MKCGYQYCKYGGEVDKDNAVKRGNRYYHEKCSYEADMKAKIRDYYYEKFKTNEPIKNVNSAIKKFINDQGYDADYVMFCLKKAQVLNSIYGLSNTLFYKPNEQEFKKSKANRTKIEYQKPLNDIFEKEVRKINREKDKQWRDFF